MTAPPQTLYPASDSIEVFLALRELLAKNCCAIDFSAETLAELLYAQRYVSRRVEAHEVECALEALRLDGDLLT
jgi:hypothetical protein